MTRLSLVRQGYDWSAPGRPEPLRGGGTNFERSPDRWFRLGRNCGSPQFRPTAPGKDLLHADIEGKQLRGDLSEELPFSFHRSQPMDQLPLLVFVGGDLKPFW